MAQMLASDLQNPEFVGATNPDSLLHVEFYEHEPIDKWTSETESAKQGKKVVVKLPKRDFIRIMRPGDKDTIMECEVREEHKARFPDKWLYYLIATGKVDGGKDVPGWKVDEWPELDDQQDLLRELKFNRFWTVEQIAGAQDAQVQRLGIGGPGLRERARMALRERMRKEFAADMDAKDAKIAEMEAKQKRMEEQLNALLDAATKPGAPAKAK